MSRYFGLSATGAPTTVAEDGARQTVLTRANTYVQGLIQLAGTLYLFTTDSPSTEHAAGTVAAVRTSTDDGVTWSTATSLYAGGGAGRHGNVESAFKTSTDRILLALDDQSDSNPFDVVPKVIYSDDGSTWSSPYSVTNTFSGDCVTGDFAENGGDVLLSLYGEQTGVVGGNTFVKRVKSTDDGATFGSEITVASSASRTYQEPQLTWTGSEYVMLMRSDTNVHTWRTTSADGTTWSTPADVVNLSGPPDFIQWYSAGYLFCMARNDNTVWRPRWSRSFDAGATWGTVAEVDTGETRELDGTALCFIDATHFLTVYALANSSSSSTIYLRRWVIS